MALPLYYNWRNLFVRKLSNGLTFAVVAVLVLILCVLLSFAAGIRASLSASGAPDNVLVLKPGATAESTSIIVPEEYTRLTGTPGLARTAAGDVMLSQELCVQTSLPRRNKNGALANVAVRGVDPVAFDVHREVRLIEGRRFEPGQMEIVVGKAARDRYQNLQVGGRVPLGRLANREFTVVGIFESAGSALESEVWAPRSILSDVYMRRLISSAVLHIANPADVPAALAYVNGPTVQLDARRETDYYKDLSSKTREIVVLTTILITIMSAGAAFAVANTMHAAVDGRRREIAMLRTIGFARGSIIIAFVTESVLICLAACVVGLAGSMLLNGQRQDFLSDTTWTVLAYELRITPNIALAALIVSTIVGVVGAVAPAMRASRVHVIEALRRA